jgi:hypothetical protein
MIITPVSYNHVVFFHFLFFFLQFFRYTTKKKKKKNSSRADYFFIIFFYLLAGIDLSVDGPCAQKNAFKVWARALHYGLTIFMGGSVLF